MNKAIVILCIFMMTLLAHANSAPIILSCQIEGQEEPDLIKILAKGGQNSWQFWYKDDKSWGLNICNENGVTSQGSKYKQMCYFSPGQFKTAMQWEGGRGKLSNVWNEFIIDRTTGKYSIVKMIYTPEGGFHPGLRPVLDDTNKKTIGECEKGVEPMVGKTKF